MLGVYGERASESIRGGGTVYTRAYRRLANELMKSCEHVFVVVIYVYCMYTYMYEGACVGCVAVVVRGVCDYVREEYQFIDKYCIVPGPVIPSIGLVFGPCAKILFNSRTFNACEKYRRFDI